MSSTYVQFPSRPVPPVTSDTRDWWEHTRRRTLTVQACKHCEQSQLYPRTLCVSCGSLDLELVPVSGAGTVYSFTVLAKSPNPDQFVPPYVVALVRLTEGPVLLTNVVGADPGDIFCDLPVTLAWDPLPDGRQVPLFTPDHS